MASFASGILSLSTVTIKMKYKSLLMPSSATRGQ